MLHLHSHLLLQLLLLLLLLLLLVDTAVCDEGKIQFIVVVDAGSTSSRANVYRTKYSSNSISGYELLNSTSFRQEPGLATFRSIPCRCRTYLWNIVNWAKLNVPQKFLDKTPIVFGGTAGFRLISATARTRIKGIVNEIVAKSGFAVNSSNAGDGIVLLTGSDEARYTWLSVNYLFNNLNAMHRSGGRTLPILEVGGGSLQTAYKVMDHTATSVEIKLRNGTVIPIRAVSYLGLGTMASALKMANRSTAGGSGIYVTPCLKDGAVLNFSFANDYGQIRGDSLTKNADRYDVCSKIAKRLIEQLNVTQETAIGNDSVIIGVSALYYIVKYLSKNFDKNLIKIQEFNIACNGVNGHLTGSCLAMKLKLDNLKVAAEYVCKNLKITEDKYEPYYCSTLTVVVQTLVQQNIDFQSHLQIIKADKHNPIGWTLGFGFEKLTAIAEVDRHRNMVAVNFANCVFKCCDNLKIFVLIILQFVLANV